MIETVITLGLAARARGANQSVLQDPKTRQILNGFDVEALRRQLEASKKFLEEVENTLREQRDRLSEPQNAPKKGTVSVEQDALDFAAKSKNETMKLNKLKETGSNLSDRDMTFVFWEKTQLNPAILQSKDLVFLAKSTLSPSSSERRLVTQYNPISPGSYRRRRRDCNRRKSRWLNPGGIRGRLQFVPSDLNWKKWEGYCNPGRWLYRHPNFPVIVLDAVTGCF